ECARTVLIDVLDFAACWRMDLLSFDRLLPLVPSRLTVEQREALLHCVVERRLFAHPTAVTAKHLDNLRDMYLDVPQLRYFLYYLAGRPGVVESHQQARTLVGSRFKLHS